MPTGLYDHQFRKRVEQIKGMLIKGLPEIWQLSNDGKSVERKAALKRAKAENDPYEIVHIDGHEVYDRRVG